MRKLTVMKMHIHVHIILLNSSKSLSQSSRESLSAGSDVEFQPFPMHTGIRFIKRPMGWAKLFRYTVNCIEQRFLVSRLKLLVL